MAIPPTTAASQFYLPVMAGIPLHEDVAGAVETPRLDADMVLDSNGHGSTQPDEATVAQPAATGSEWSRYSALHQQLTCDAKTHILQGQ